MRRRAPARSAGRRVRADGHDRRMVEFEPLVEHQLRQVLLRVVLGPRDAHRQATVHRREERVLGALEGLGRALVALQVGGVPGRDDRGQGVGRGRHVHGERSNQVERAAVDATDVRDGVAGRVLHQHPARAVEQRRAPASSISLAAAVGLDLEAEAGEVARVDVVDQQARLAVAGHVQERAPRRVQRARGAEQAAEGRVGAAEVVDQPAVGGGAVELVGNAAGAPREQ